jgi:hypothetical protein
MVFTFLSVRNRFFRKKIPIAGRSNQNKNQSEISLRTLFWLISQPVVGGEREQGMLLLSDTYIQLDASYLQYSILVHSDHFTTIPLDITSKISPSNKAKLQVSSNSNNITLNYFRVKTGEVCSLDGFWRQNDESTMA